jgi:hypothetical protein
MNSLSDRCLNVTPLFRNRCSQMKRPSQPHQAIFIRICFQIVILFPTFITIYLYIYIYTLYISWRSMNHYPLPPGAVVVLLPPFNNEVPIVVEVCVHVAPCRPSSERMYRLLQLPPWHCYYFPHAPLPQ